MDTPGFNRYMVECEYAKIFDELKAVRVLIDTWWNVNFLFGIILSICRICFNRYMVECEFAYNIGTIAGLTSFNRYMVECEFCKAYNQTSTITGFNRYMVECE